TEVSRERVRYRKRYPSSFRRGNMPIGPKFKREEASLLISSPRFTIPESTGIEKDSMSSISSIFELSSKFSSKTAFFFFRSNATSVLGIDFLSPARSFRNEIQF